MALVTMYDRNGNRTQVPEHWLEHPRISSGFTKTPPRKTLADQAPADGDTQKKEK